MSVDWIGWFFVLVAVLVAVMVAWMVGAYAGNSRAKVLRSSCPANYVCIPRSVLNKMSQQDIDAAKQLATQFGVRWKIVE